MATNKNYSRETLLFSLTVAICLAALVLPIIDGGLARPLALSPQPVVIRENPPAGTYFDHLVFIIMENEGINDICGQSPPPCNGSNTPYMSALANEYGIDQQYLRVGAGTSQPQYIAIMAASQQNCTSGCGTSGTLHAVNLVDRLESAGLSWKAYMEDQGASSGCVSSDTGFYQAIHNPFVSFNDIFTNPTRCSNIVLANPSGCGSTTDCSLINDLNSGSAPNFMWLTPNNCDNMHAASGCPNGCTSAFSSTCLKDGDNYLKSVANNILNSTTFKTTNSALFITFDEGNGFCPGPFPSGEDCMYNVWSGPSAKTAYFNSTLFNHYSFTKTIETNWSLSTMTSNDASATPMTAFLKAQTSADFSISASPTSINVLSSAQATSTITLNSLNSFTGTVTLAVSSSPTGPTLNLNPTIIALTPGGSGTSTLTATSSTTGNYTITVTGTSGALQHTTTVTVHVQDYSISSNPTSIKTNSGTQGTSTITVSPINHFTGTVSLSVTGSTGLTVSISPTSITGGSGTSTLTANSSTTGNYTATITSTSGSLTHTITVNVQVVSFTIAATSPSPVNAGSSASSTITITSVNHFSGTVTLTDSAQSGLTCGTIAPNSITGSGTATVSCSATAFGNYTLTITGTSGSLTRTATATFQFREYAIAASPPTVTANAGATATSSITITGQNGFVAVVNLSTNSTSCGLSPTSVTGTGSSNLSCTFSSAGNYHAAVTGTSGTLSHSVTVTFKIQNFTIAASPTSIDANAGSQATSTITISSVNGFAGAVNLATNSTLCSITPTTVTGSGSSTLSCTLNSAGNVHVSVTGANGSLSHSVMVTFVIQDFTLTSNPSTVTVNANAPGTSTITASAVNGFTGVVNLTTNSTSCTVSPASLTGSGSSTLTCTFTSAGTRHVSVTGNSSNLSHNATITFQVLDFAISTAGPAPANVGTPLSTTITLTSLNQFTGTISLTDTVPAGLTCNPISPSTVNGSGTATLSCTSSIAGNYTVTITGTSSNLVRSANSNFRYQDYTLTATAPSIVNARSTVASALTIVSINGFNGTVSLSDSLPTGLTCSAISPETITGSGTGSVSCSSMTAGNYTLSLTATSTTLTHSTTTMFRFADFTITVTTPPPTDIGRNINSIITVSAVNQFSSTVSLSLTIPMGVSCNPLSPSSVPGFGTSTLTCSANLSGNYTVQVRGTAGVLSHTTVINIQALDFAVGSSPTSLSTPVGTNATSTITLSSLNGYQGNITMTTSVQTQSTTGGPGGIGGGRMFTMSAPAQVPDPILTPSSLVLNATGSQSALTIIVPTGTLAGNYTIVITASDAMLSHTVLLLLVVTDFSFTSSTTNIVLAPGTNSTTTLSLQSLNSFQGNITFSTSISPSGPTATVNPTQLFLASSGSTVLTVTVPSTTPLGNYTLIVQASSSSLLRTISIRISVKTGPTSIFVKLLQSSDSVPSGIGAALATLSMISIRVFKKGRADNLHQNRRLSHQLRSYPNKNRFVGTSNLFPTGPLWTRLEQP